MQQEIEKNNLYRVLDLFQENEFLTRKEIVEKTRLTYPTVGKMLKKLLAEKIISFGGVCQSNGGRRPEKYQLNSRRFYIIEIILRAQKIEILLVSLKKEIIKGKEYQVKYGNNLGDSLIKILNEFLGELNKKNDNILGMGISFPGVVDEKQAVCVFSAIIDVENLLLKDILEKEFSLPVWIENDVNLMAAGEHKYNNLENYQSFIYLYWGTGIGSALMDNNAIKKGFAGQLGHNIVKVGGELCFCGKQGCLETVLAPNSLTDFVNKRLTSGVNSSLQKYKEINVLSVLKEAQKKDKLALMVAEKMVDYLSLALSNYIELLAPEVVILNGKPFLQYPFIIDKLAKSVYSRVMYREYRNLKIQKSTLDKKAEIYGLMLLVKEKEYKKRTNEILGYS